MTRLATILLCAWVLWMEVYSLKEGAREWSPLSAYPAESYQACLDGVKAHVETQVEGQTAENRSVMRYSRGSREPVTADLKTKGIYHWTFRCVPDTLDPRAKRQTGRAPNSHSMRWDRPPKVTEMGSHVRRRQGS